MNHEIPLASALALLYMAGSATSPPENNRCDMLISAFAQDVSGPRRCSHFSH